MYRADSRNINKECHMPGNENKDHTENRIDHSHAMQDTQSSILERVLAHAEDTRDHHYEMMKKTLERSKLTEDEKAKLNPTARFILESFNSDVEGFVGFSRLEETPENLAIFKAALANNPNLLNAKNLCGNTALIEAASGNRNEFAKILLSTPGINITSKSLFEKLDALGIVASSTGDTSQMMFTLAPHFGLDLSGTRFEELYKLHVNAIISISAIFKTAHENNSDLINITNMYDNTASLTVATQHRMDFAKMLLTSQGIDITDKTLFGGLIYSEQATGASSPLVDMPFALPPSFRLDLSGTQFEALYSQRLSDILSWAASDNVTMYESLPWQIGEARKEVIKTLAPTSGSLDEEEKAVTSNNPVVIKSRLSSAQKEFDRCRPFEKEYHDVYQDVSYNEMWLLEVIAKAGGSAKHLNSVQFSLAKRNFERAKSDANFLELEAKARKLQAPVSHSLFSSAISHLTSSALLIPALRSAVNYLSSNANSDENDVDMITDTPASNGHGM